MSQFDGTTDMDIWISVDGTHTPKMDIHFFLFRNGQRVMRELGRVCRAYCHHKDTTWLKKLPDIEQCFSSVPRESTGRTMLEILTAHKPKRQLDTLVRKLLPENPPFTGDAVRNSVNNRLKQQAEKRKGQQKAKKHIFRFC